MGNKSEPLCNLLLNSKEDVDKLMCEFAYMNRTITVEDRTRILLAIKKLKIQEYFMNEWYEKLRHSPGKVPISVPKIKKLRSEGYSNNEPLDSQPKQKKKKKENESKPILKSMKTPYSGIRCYRIESSGSSHRSSGAPHRHPVIDVSKLLVDNHTVSKPKQLICGYKRKKEHFQWVKIIYTPMGKQNKRY